MIGFRIPATAMFLFSLIPLAAAENTVSDTYGQHHLWSQKFASPSDPEVTGSNSRQIRQNVHLGQKTYVPEALRFSHAPLVEWRIGSCS